MKKLNLNPDPKSKRQSNFNGTILLCALIKAKSGMDTVAKCTQKLRSPYYVLSWGIVLHSGTHKTPVHDRIKDILSTTKAHSHFTDGNIDLYVSIYDNSISVSTIYVDATQEHYTISYDALKVFAEEYGVSLPTTFKVPKGVETGRIYTNSATDNSDVMEVEFKQNDQLRLNNAMRDKVIPEPTIEPIEIVQDAQSICDCDVQELYGVVCAKCVETEDAEINRVEQAVEEVTNDYSRKQNKFSYKHAWNNINNFFKNKF